MDDIKEMRSEIDAIDASLAQLYRQRMEAARRIGRFKLEHNLPVDDPQREAQLLAARTAELEPELRPGFERLLRELIRASKRCQRRKRIFAQGTP
ncbi:MAG: chorismate mutase [Oscillospiraceae bacterium]|nr:MAG: chorismate mutase [Oscillospiraceae bacterium]